MTVFRRAHAAPSAAEASARACFAPLEDDP